jgi:membrane protein DedA with SNARE-associated domain
MTDLPGVFGTVAPYIDDYGLLAVAVLVFIENLGIPMPGEATLVLAGIYTKSGELNLVAVLLVGWVAAVVGDNIAFGIGRYGGRPLVLRLGRRFGLTHEVLDRVEAFYERHGSKTVAAGRFLPILRHLNGLAAGVTVMTWRRFVVANMIGAGIWVAVWVTVGRLAGAHIDGVNKLLERGAPAIAIVLVLLFSVHLLRLRRRRRIAMAEPLDDDLPEHDPTEEHE